MSKQPDNIKESDDGPRSLAQTWRPKHAWFFFGMTLLITNVINLVLGVWEENSPAFYSFRREPAGHMLFLILGLVLIFVVGLYFAHPKSLPDFAAACGLTRPREQEILVAVTAGLLVQFGFIFIFKGSLIQLRVARTFSPFF